MNIQQFYLIFAVVLFSSIRANPIEQQISLPEDSESVGEVVFVNVLYRHGDRTPVECYPKDPYGDPKYWPVGWGQLTTTGMHQHYDLGKWMRNRYKALLVNDYIRDDIYIQSTDVDRTLMSALSHLAGMYPPTPNHTFDGNLPWQPIPVHTIPELEDEILSMKKHCRNYEEQLNKVKETDPELVEFVKKFKDVFAFLSEQTGANVHDIKSAEYIYSTLHIEALYNFTLPEWSKKVYPEPLMTIAKKSFTLPTFTRELGRLKSGPLLKQMLKNLRTKINKEMQPDRKMFMYSAHDTTVANFLNSLKLLDPGLPPYTATVLMELRKKGEDYFVAVLYKNTTAEPMLLTLPHCTAYCPMEKFESLLQPLLPGDWEEECGNITSSNFKVDTLKNLLFILLTCQEEASKASQQTVRNLLMSVPLGLSGRLDTCRLPFGGRRWTPRSKRQASGPTL